MEHSCSIRDARYLSPEMLAAVLTRFKEHLQNGDYDDAKHIAPLLTEDEQSYIKQQQILERENQEQQWQKDREDKTIKAAALMQKHQDNEDIKALLVAHYGDDVMVTSEFGNIDFSLDGMSDIVGGEKLSYDDYWTMPTHLYH